MNLAINEATRVFEEEKEIRVDAPSDINSVE